MNVSSEAHVDIIVFEVFLTSIVLIPQYERALFTDNIVFYYFVNFSCIFLILQLMYLLVFLFGIV